MTLRRAGLRCGQVAPVLWVLLIGGAGALRSDFNPLTNYISELGERGSSTGPFINYAAFMVTGALYVWFAAAIAAAGWRGWAPLLGALLIALEGSGRIGAGVYPCDAGCEGASTSQELHRLFATIGFVSGVAAALVWGIIGGRRQGSQRFAVYSLATGVVAAALLLRMTAEPPAPFIGLIEHAASGLLSLWLWAFATRMLREE